MTREENMDEIERRLIQCEDDASEGDYRHAFWALCIAVRLLATRPAPAGGGIGWRTAWENWCVGRAFGYDLDINDTSEQVEMAFRAGWDAARAADAARGER